MGRSFMSSHHPWPMGAPVTPPEPGTGPSRALRDALYGSHPDVDFLARLTDDLHEDGVDWTIARWLDLPTALAWLDGMDAKQALALGMLIGRARSS